MLPFKDTWIVLAGSQEPQSSKVPSSIVLGFCFSLSQFFLLNRAQGSHHPTYRNNGKIGLETSIP